MFVTPFLGLLDTFHHGRLATYSVRHGEKVFDNYENGSEITFHEAWSPFKIENQASFLSFPSDAALAMIPVILISHIFLSALILKLSMNGQASITQLVLQGLHTFISPPLHFDWEFYYRLKCGNTSVRDSWKRFCESRSDMNQLFNSYAHVLQVSKSIVGAHPFGYIGEHAIVTSVDFSQKRHRKCECKTDIII